MTSERTVRAIIPEIDADEDRLDPVEHRFVHGQFAGHRRFRMQFPTAWNGDFLLLMGGGYGGNEYQAEQRSDAAGFVGDVPLRLGYVIAESNQGHIGQVWRPDDTYEELDTVANVELTEYALEQTIAHYGREPRRRLLFGYSGGGWRATSLLERHPDLFDGAALGAAATPPRYMAYMYSLFERYYPVVGPDLDAIVASRDVGEDPMRRLSPEAAAALESLYRAGAPRGGEFCWPLSATNTARHGFALIPLLDPTYFEEFWTVPGYGGAEGEFESLRRAIASRVTGLGPVDAYGHQLSFGLEFDETPADMSLASWRVDVRTGAEAGRRVHIWMNKEAQVSVMPNVDRGGELAHLRAGDEVVVSNDDAIAWAHYYRHIGRPSQPEYGEVYVDGRPRWVQRPGAVQDAYDQFELTGRITVPAIVTIPALDQMIWPPTQVRWPNLVAEHFGERADEFIRVYMLENAGHSEQGNYTSDINRNVERCAPWHRTFRLLNDWLDGIAVPPSSTRFEMRDGQVQFEDDPRLGIQPVIRLDADLPITCAVGEPVTLAGRASSPVGNIVGYEWDYVGGNRYAESWGRVAEPAERHHQEFTPAPSARVDAVHCFGQPGRYVAFVRVYDDTTTDWPDDCGVRNVARIVVDVVDRR